MKTFIIMLALISGGTAFADTWQQWDGMWMPSENDPRMHDATRRADGSIRCRGQVRRHRSRVTTTFAKAKAYRLAYRYFCLPGQGETRLAEEQAPDME